MKTRALYFFLIIIASLFLFSGTGNATAPETGEEALFTTSTAPDALILLDLSGSMAWNPAGGDEKWGNSSCSGTFYSSSGTGHTVDCSRLAIAKRAIFNVLDDNNDNTINASDEGSLGVRIGYMRYYNCGSDDTGGSYTSGCIQIPGSSSSSRRYIGSKYSQIYCNNSTSCAITSTGSYSVGGESATGGTPLASALNEANIYLDAHKAADAAKACRQKFVILLTDGSDTYACSADGSECGTHRYKNRREVVAKAKALSDAGYKIFVIGFGSTMPSYLQNTLNWMAYYGGTDNPNTANSGSATAYNIPTGSLYPSGVTSCGTASSTNSSDNSSGYPYCLDSAGNNTTSNFYATSNDPGTLALSGYAFLAADADALATALKTTMNIIREATYSFSQASVQSSRTADENYLYEGSFQPISGDPFWFGHLRRFSIDANGNVATSEDWDAGTGLQSRDHATRTIKTYTGGAQVDFNTANITATILGVTTTAERDAIVGYFRGNPAYNPDNWKLGDVFRSTPITVGTPSIFFDDARDANNAFATHRTNHPRTSANGERLIVAGANDGQFHAFKTFNGWEAWSFIPPSMLSKLKNIAHATEPTTLTHQYFVDGPVTVADAWLGTGDGASKSASDWKTLLLFGLGRGSTDRLWSSSTSCDSGFVGNYDSTHTNYCAYYALNITSSLNPAYLWRINTFNATSQAPYMGDSWSKMMIGRVRINVSGSEKEKWVGFIGAGYNGGDCTGGGACDTRGKGFFVIDLADGSVLWSYTRYNDANVTHSMPAQPAIVDTDNDGFVDRVYLGDLGGNMWRFKFCRAADMPSCGTSNWSGGMFFDSATGAIRPIYTGAAVTKDTGGNLWVYWGTGDKTDPTGPNAQEHFYAVIDRDQTDPANLQIDNLMQDTDVWNYTGKPDGYRIQLAGGGQKILAEPTVFGGVVYFTTYTPSTGSDPCEQSGTASLYAVKYATGTGALAGNARSMGVGAGIPSAPVLSLKPGAGGTADLYVTVSGGGSTGASTSRVNMNPPGVSNRTNMLYWLDKRLQ
jgi:Tfp pilus tip-associated adhesin PilY1